MSRQWADGYGARWYLHKDGKPPHDDDNDYVWRNGQWCIDQDEAEIDEDVLEEYEERRRERIALQWEDDALWED